MSEMRALRHDRTHRMSEAELNSWRQRSATATNEAQSAAHKRQQSLDFLRAVESGDMPRLKATLAAGANPNARLKNGNRASAFALAVANNNSEMALTILLAGGWLNPPANAPRPHDLRAVQANPKTAESFTPEQLRKLGEHTLSAFSTIASSWSQLAAAAAFFSPSESKESLICRVISNAWKAPRAELLAEAANDGAQIGIAVWNALTKHSRTILSLENQKGREGLFDLLSMPTAAASLNSAHAEHFYAAAMLQSDEPLLRALLDAGLRPNEQWKLPAFGARRSPSLAVAHQAGRVEATASLAWLAADTPDSNFLATILSCEPLMAAARRFPDGPWAMENLSVGKLLAMEEAGLSIDKVDSKGRNLLHVWAEIDDLPRAGWATIAKQFPALFAGQDADLRTGAQLMSMKLSRRHGDGAQLEHEFSASLSRIENREIRKAIPAPAKKKVPGFGNRL